MWEIVSVQYQREDPLFPYLGYGLKAGCGGERAKLEEGFDFIQVCYEEHRGYHVSKKERKKFHLHEEAVF